MVRVIRLSVPGGLPLLAPTGRVSFEKVVEVGMRELLVAGLERYAGFPQLGKHLFLGQIGLLLTVMGNVQRHDPSKDVGE
jgi:hypothetical protein